jgi:hypothetical protein
MLRMRCDNQLVLLIIPLSLWQSQSNSDLSSGMTKGVENHLFRLQS